MSYFPADVDWREQKCQQNSRTDDNLDAEKCKQNTGTVEQPGKIFPPSGTSCSLNVILMQCMMHKFILIICK